MRNENHSKSEYRRWPIARAVRPLCAMSSCVYSGGRQLHSKGSALRHSTPEVRNHFLPVVSMYREPETWARREHRTPQLTFTDSDLELYKCSCVQSLPIAARAQAVLLASAVTSASAAAFAVTRVAPPPLFARRTGRFKYRIEFGVPTSS